MKTYYEYLNEDVYGYQAIVYHRTIQPGTQEADLITRCMKDWYGINSVLNYIDHDHLPTLNNIITTGFHTKFHSAGKMYGNGVYCNYDLYSSLGALGNNSLKTMQKYGVTIIKSKLNLINSLILDLKIAKKVFGKDFSFRSQCNRIGLSDIVADLDSGKLIDGTNDSTYFDTIIGLEKLTSDFAIHLIDNYKIDQRIGSILFTGSRDGHVAVVYNPKLLVPYSFSINMRDSLGKEYNTDFVPLSKTSEKIKSTIKRHINDLTDKEFDNIRTNQNKMNLIKQWGNGFTAFEDIDTGKFGIVDTDLNVLVPAKYDLVKWSGYSSNRDYLNVYYRLNDPVIDDGYKIEYKVGVVDNTGREIIEPGLWFNYQLSKKLDQLTQRKLE